MKTHPPRPRPTAHRWEPVPVHGGPALHRCALCGLQVWEDEAHAAYCAPRVEKITPHPLPTASDNSLAVCYDLITPTLHE